MSKVLNTNMLDIQRGVLVHQVNCRGAMGRGLALAIRQKWPRVYSEYRKKLARGELELGTIQLVQVEPDLYVCNLAGQDRWGTLSPKTDMGAYSLAWPIVSLEAAKLKLPIYAPWMIGCGLGGGNWEIVQPLVEALCPEVNWVRKPEQGWVRSENYRGF